VAGFILGTMFSNGGTTRNLCGLIRHGLIESDLVAGLARVNTMGSHRCFGSPIFGGDIRWKGF
jgi:hypothetical protein